MQKRKTRAKTAYLLGRLNVYLKQNPQASNREISESLGISLGVAAKWGREWRVLKGIARNPPGPAPRAFPRREDIEALERLFQAGLDIVTPFLQPRPPRRKAHPATITIEDLLNPPTTTTEGTPSNEQAPVHQ